MSEEAKKNIHAMPRITKVTVAAGVGKNRDNKAYLEAVQQDLAKVTGQKAAETRAKKAIAAFKVREGNIVGYRSTLRGERAKQFTERFVNLTLPRVRDFRGISQKALDRQGNLTVGLNEHLAFPEIHSEQTDVIFGVEVTFSTSTLDKEEALTMLRAEGFPFNE